MIRHKTRMAVVGIRRPALPSAVCSCICGLAAQIEAPAALGHELINRVKMALQTAKSCKEKGEKRVILFNFSGHGLIDMAAYDSYFAGKLSNYEHPQSAIDEALAHLPEV